MSGCAAICVLVLVLARLAQTLGEDLAAVPWSENAALWGVSITYLTVIPLTARRWSPGLATMHARRSNHAPGANPVSQSWGSLPLAAAWSSSSASFIGLVPDHRLRGRHLRGNGTRVEDRADHPPLRCRGRCCRWPNGVRGHMGGTRFLDGNRCYPAVVIVVLPAMMLGASAAASRRTPGRSDPEALRRECWRAGRGCRRD